MALLEITIKNIRIRTLIGIHEWERTRKQNLLISFTIRFDSAKAARSENIKDTIDYCELTKRLVGSLEARNFELVETLMELVLDIVMEDQRIRNASVTIEKPEPLKSFADTILIKGERARD